MKSLIGEIVSVYSKSKRSYEPMLSKGVYGKQLQTLLNETDLIAPEDLKENYLTIPLNGPIYEEQFKLSEIPA